MEEGFVFRGGGVGEILTKQIRATSPLVPRVTCNKEPINKEHAGDVSVSWRSGKMALKLFVFLILFCVLAGLASGCTTSDDCRGSQLCCSGTCRSSCYICYGNSDCGSGKKCCSGSGKCVSTSSSCSSCSSSSDCGYNKTKCCSNGDCIHSSDSCDSSVASVVGIVIGTLLIIGFIAAILFWYHHSQVPSDKHKRDEEEGDKQKRDEKEGDKEEGDKEERDEE